MITVNLLPDSILQLRKRQHVKRKGIFWLSVIGGILGVLALIMFGVMLLSMRQRDTAHENNESMQELVFNEEETQKREDALKVKSAVDSLAGMMGNQRQFAIFLDDIADNTPQSIAVRSVSLSPNNEFQMEGRTEGGYDGIATYLGRLRAQDSLFSNIILYSANTVSTSTFGYSLSGVYEGGIPERDTDGAEDETAEQAESETPSSENGEEQ